MSARMNVGVRPYHIRHRYSSISSFRFLGRTQQPGVMALHCFVALTSAVLQCFRIDDLDFPAGVLD